MRFLHAADVHIDSQLRGLARYDGAPADRLRFATRQAFENLVQLAIHRTVDFVILAGDLFDGHWPDIQTGLWTARQFARLRDANIAVYMIRGNHDAASIIPHDLSWPENVFCFPEDRPATHQLNDLKVALHGQGFADRETRQDLASQYPEPIPGMFNIGLLHTSLSGTTDHDVYAPTHEDVLVARRYDYWALGHVHQRRVVRPSPPIVYPGNTQGRHIRETGAKGCYLVEVVDQQIQQLDFIPTDTLRWVRLEVDLENDTDRSSVMEQVQRQLGACRAEADGRYLAVRVVLRGACPLHQEVIDPGVHGQLIQQLRYEASHWDQEAWIEKIEFQTEPLIDLQQLRKSAGPMGELLREIARLQEQPDAWDQLTEWLEPLERKAAAELYEAGVKLRDREALQRWLRDAEFILAGLESS